MSENVKLDHESQYFSIVRILPTLGLLPDIKTDLFLPEAQTQFEIQWDNNILLFLPQNNLISIFGFYLTTWKTFYYGSAAAF